MTGPHKAAIPRGEIRALGVSAMDRCERGEAPDGALDALLAEQGTEAAQCWRLALWAQALVGRGVSWKLPSPASLSGFLSSEGCCDPLWRLCVKAQRVAILSFDVPSFAAWAQVHRAAAEKRDDPEAHLWLRVADAWRQWMDGATEGADQILQDVRREAASSGLSLAVIEATTLRSLLALYEGDRKEAVSLARRASRMGRTEAIPEGEFLASLALARSRRWSGRPHLASRILSALARYVPPLWEGWVSWERLLSGSIDVAAKQVERWRREDHPLHDSTAAGHVHAGLAALQSTLRAELPGGTVPSDDAPKPFGSELLALSHILDPQQELEGMDEPLRLWASGGAHDPPSGLAGLVNAPRAWSGAAAAAPIIVVSPHGTPRRYPCVCLALVEHLGATPLGEAGRLYARGEVGNALVACAGPEGMDVAAFFEEVFAFPYEKAVHATTLNVLVHRMRKRLGARAEMVRDGDRLKLVPQDAIVLLDPRTAESLEESLLRVLAESRGQTARQLATRLKVPLRTVQEALKNLVEEESCTVAATGRSKKYAVEDTTFSEPTEQRLGDRTVG